MSRILFLLLLLFPFISFTQNKDFNESIKRIGLKESKVMEIASTICDEYGPRLTGSAKLAKAQDWAVTELKSWGISNVHKEEWGPFGRG